MFMPSPDRRPYVTILAGALLIASTAQPAFATEDADFAFDTTEDLYTICSTSETDPNYAPAQLACTAFIEATVQYHDAVSDRKHMKRLVCYPEGTSIADGRTAFLAWAKQNAGNAERMGELPVVGLVRALAAAYPCK
jgi:hypothetical protein